MRTSASVPLTSSFPLLSLLEEILYDLPPLEGVLLQWHRHGAAVLTPGSALLFPRRQQLPGPLCTSAGIWRLSRKALHVISKALGLANSKSRHAKFNPESFQAGEECGMLPGRVSPFLHPLRSTRLTVLVVLSWPRCWEAHRRDVAIALSLWGSLDLPPGFLHLLLRLYASRAYPALHLIDLHGTQGDGESNASSPRAPAEAAVHLLVGIDQRGERR